jgi:hypothetical protein
MGTVVQLSAARRERGNVMANVVHIANRNYIPHNINVQETAAVMYWCRHFDTTPEQLFEAVKKVGTNPAIVRFQLRMRAAQTMPQPTPALAQP